MASFEKVIAERSDMDRFIPQRDPMVMIDELVRVEGKLTVTSMTVRENNIFFEKGRLREPGLIENMAQTAAAGAGYAADLEKREPQLGFIGGIKNLRIHELPKSGDKLLTETVVTNEVFDATIVSAKVTSEDRILAECELRIFLIKN